MFKIAVCDDNDTTICSQIENIILSYIAITEVQIAILLGMSYIDI